MRKKDSLLHRLYSENDKVTFSSRPEAWSVKIGRFFGMPLARGLASLPFKVNPSIITGLTIPFALIAAYCFYKNLLIYGAIFFLISWILDCTDGVLARITKSTSSFGYKFDNYSDRVNNFAMFLGLWYSQFYLNDQWLLGACIFSAHYLIMLFGTLFLGDYSYKTIFKSLASYYHPNDEGFLTFFMLPVLGVFVLVYPIVVILQYVSTIVLFIVKRKKRG